MIVEATSYPSDEAQQSTTGGLAVAKEILSKQKGAQFAHAPSQDEESVGTTKIKTGGDIHRPDCILPTISNRFEVERQQSLNLPKKHSKKDDPRVLIKKEKNIGELELEI